ncbi:MAG: hypothetical protein J5I59_07425 [Saprospiraceae bacterium]|nr:hypothetical protein [Saprospiraceae bacterium]
MEYTLSNKYFRFSVLSLFIVATLGTLMRYKIAYSLPVFEQKNLLHAHSHFAFSGWISHVLYCGLASIVLKYVQTKRYHILIIANLICSVGMLIAFTIQGYKAVSIAFSTGTMIVSFAFAIQMFLDWRKIKGFHPSRNWSLAAVFLNVLAAAGPLFLAYMIVTKTTNHSNYLGSVYYYLHFEYNGWFFFATMAMIIQNFKNKFKELERYFVLLFVASIPTFFLSILWAKLPDWLFIITVLMTFLQMVVWILMLKRYFSPVKAYLIENHPYWIRLFCYTAILAITIKFVLQSISVIPSLSQLVFGIRPIIIAYLHLVLLGVYSLFLISYLIMRNYITITPVVKYGALIFLTGVFLNEILLGIQGFAAFAYIPISHINDMLFIAAVVLFGGSGILFFSQAFGSDKGTKAIE